MPTPGSTTARGYGAHHQQTRAHWAPKADAGLVDCWRCGRPIHPGQPWDLGHDDHDRSITRGPEHRHATPWCKGNRAAGAANRGSIRRPRIKRTPIEAGDW